MARNSRRTVPARWCDSGARIARRARGLRLAQRCYRRRCYCCWRKGERARARARARAEDVGNHPAASVIASLRRSVAIASFKTSTSSYSLSPFSPLHLSGSIALSSTAPLAVLPSVPNCSELRLVYPTSEFASLRAFVSSHLFSYRGSIAANPPTFFTGTRLFAFLLAPLAAAPILHRLYSRIVLQYSTIAIFVARQSPLVHSRGVPGFITLHLACSFGYAGHALSVQQRCTVPYNRHGIETRTRYIGASHTGMEYGYFSWLLSLPTRSFSLPTFVCFFFLFFFLFEPEAHSRSCISSYAIWLAWFSALLPKSFLDLRRSYQILVCLAIYSIGLVSRIVLIDHSMIFSEIIIEWRICRIGHPSVAWCEMTTVFIVHGYRSKNNGCFDTNLLFPKKEIIAANSGKIPMLAVEQSIGTRWAHIEDFFESFNLRYVTSYVQRRETEARKLKKVINDPRGGIDVGT